MSVIPPHSRPLNPPQSQLIAFDHAEVRMSQFNNELFLFVTGEQPKKGWNAMLTPLINQQTPDYLTVEVLRARADYMQESHSEANYQLSLPLNFISGKKGVMLIGANATKQIDI